MMDKFQNRLLEADYRNSDKKNMLEFLSCSRG